MSISSYRVSPLYEWSVLEAVLDSFVLVHAISWFLHVPLLLDQSTVLWSTLLSTYTLVLAVGSHYIIYAGAPAGVLLQPYVVPVLGGLLTSLVLLRTMLERPFGAGAH